METKICSKCKGTKDIAEFSWKNKVKAIRQCVCRSCRKEHRAAWYKVAGDKERSRLSKNERRSIERFALYKSTLKCSKCSESHPACLDFHHRDGEQKMQHVSVAAKRWSWKRLMTEIAKCDVLCSNCHRKLHYEQRQYSVMDNATASEAVIQ